MPRTSSRHRRTARAAGTLALFPFLLTPAGKIGAGVLVAALAAGGMLVGQPLGDHDTPTAQSAPPASPLASLRPTSHHSVPPANEVVVELDGVPVHLTLSGALDASVVLSDLLPSHPGHPSVAPATNPPSTPRVRQVPVMVPGIQGGPPRIVLRPAAPAGGADAGPQAGTLPPPAPSIFSPGAPATPTAGGPSGPSAAAPPVSGPQIASNAPPSGRNAPESFAGDPTANITPGEGQNPPTRLAGLPPAGEGFLSGLPSQAEGSAVPNPIPEPASIALMAVGLAGLLWMRHRHTRPLRVRPR